MNNHLSRQSFAKTHFFNDDRYTPEIINKLYECMSNMEWNNTYLYMKEIKGNYSTCLQGDIKTLIELSHSVIDINKNKQALRMYDNYSSSLFPVQKVTEQGTNYIINYENDEYEFYDTTGGIRMGAMYVSSYESRRESELKRFHHFIRNLKHFPDYNKYNIINGINFYEYDVHESHYAKKLALMSLLNLSSEGLDLYVTRVSLKYSKSIEYDFNKQCQMKVVKTIVDSIIKNRPNALNEPMLSRFIRVINGVYIHDEIVRVQDVILENNQAFDNLFDTYMYKNHYSIILQYATDIVNGIEGQGTNTFDEDRLVKSILGA